MTAAAGPLADRTYVEWRSTSGQRARGTVVGYHSAAADRIRVRTPSRGMAVGSTMIVDRSRLRVRR